jgi:23S rRNA (uracil1939-C5)-methyltransferase
MQTEVYQTGDLLELSLESVAFGGESIARHEGMVVFVEGGIDGEKVWAEITQVKKSFLRARVKEVLQASPHRIHPACEVYGRCGGCQYQHISYEHQLTLKENQVREVFERIGRFKDVPLLPILASPNPFHYRTRVDFHYDLFKGTEKLGFFDVDGRFVVDLEECPISTQGINTEFGRLREDLKSGALAMPDWVEVVKFWDTRDGVESFFMNTRGQMDLRNIEQIVLKVCGKEFQIHPLSFFQVNTEMIPFLAQTVGAYLDLKGNEFLLDAYGGVGLFAILLAHRVRKCFGIEADKNAVRLARMNAEANGVGNCEFIDKSVEKIMKHPERFFQEIPDRVILDPTRAGCERMVLDALIKMKVPVIVYVSCNPATLARDLEILCSNGYSLDKIQPLDLFPQTKHCEAVARVTRIP